MKNRILIIDGSNLLFQMFFGMPSRIYNEQGIGIWGVLGFTGALLKIIRQTAPTHVTVLFDGESKNERKELDSAYKANRVDYSEAEKEDNPFSQLPYIYQALDYLGIAYAETTECETDDWIAGYVYHYDKSRPISHAAGEDDTEIIISSFDSDFYQLLSRRVSILRYRGDNSVIYTPEFLQEKLGIRPEQYADHKAMTGDAADNIVGAEKIGPKTATALLQEYGSLESILLHAESIKKKTVKESILRNRERLLLNQRLIRLDAKYEVPFGLEKLRYYYNGITTTEVLCAIGLK